MKYVKFIIGLVSSMCLLCCDDSEIKPESTPLPPPAEDVSGISSDSLFYTPEWQSQLLDEIGRGYFDYFFSACHPSSKLARIGTDRSPETVVLAGSAYAMTALPVAVERGWTTREKAAERFYQVCHFLNRAQRYHGAWAHWMDGENGRGKPFNQSQQSAGDLVETAFMLMALLVCSEYFDAPTAHETAARSLVEKFRKEIDWKFYTNGENVLYWAWDEKLGFAPLKIVGPCEALPAYIMALAAPDEHAISLDVYVQGWRGANYHNPGRKSYGYRYEMGAEAKGGSLFTSQHPFLWLNPYQLQDEHVDYWEFCTNHALINRHYCLYEASPGFLYNEGDWGLSACYGPDPMGYAGRCPGNDRDDGTVATTAAMGTITVTPYYALQAMNRMDSLKYLKGKYGIADAYQPATGWAEKRYLSISILPVVSIIENYRSGLIWNLAMRNPHIRRGVERAGMSVPVYPQGFCQQPVEVRSQCADLTASPDTGNYTVLYWLDSPDGQSLKFSMTDKKGNRCDVQPDLSLQSGINRLNLPYGKYAKQEYTLTMGVNQKIVDQLTIKLR